MMRVSCDLGQIAIPRKLSPVLISLTIWTLSKQCRTPDHCLSDPLPIQRIMLGQQSSIDKFLDPIEIERYLVHFQDEGLALIVQATATAGGQNPRRYGRR